jgi:DNA-binding HxlR family transcriptional regulator
MQPPAGTISSVREPTVSRAPASAGPSPLAAALDRVGDRWSLLLVEALLDGPRRFNELGEQVAGIAPNILTDRLRRLERSGIVRATPYSHRPVRMEYALTADGAELAGALRLLADWGSRREGPDAPEPLRHALCGTALEARWHCPTCGLVVSEGDAAALDVL